MTCICQLYKPHSKCSTSMLARLSWVVIINLCLGFGTSACIESKTTDWKQLYRTNSSQFYQEIEQQPVTVQESILLAILAENPASHTEICPKFTSKVAKQTCERYRMRPHLQSIEPTDQVFWTGGALGERTVFPREFVPLKSELEAVSLSDECLKSDACLLVEAEKESLNGWQKAGYICSTLSSPLAVSDCLFHIAESLPVHVDRYEDAAKLCSLSGGFAGECHNHVLLKYATKMYDRVEWHEQLMKTWNSIYPLKYAKNLGSVYWSVVAFRVIGMEYPLDTTRFLDWPIEFQPHLRSIVALRMWEEAQAFQRSKRALKGEMMRVAKARGPNAPRFTPRELWSNRDGGMKWIRFCDLRGGHRPVHENADIDLAWALLTAFAMGDQFDQEQWLAMYDGIGQKHWEVRWAMASLLKQIDQRDSILYSKLKMDSDARVLQVAF